MHYRLACHVCFLLYQCSQITTIWQTSRMGLFYIPMHEYLQTQVSRREFSCSCRRIHSNDIYCIPLKTPSWTEECCGTLGIKRGKIIKSKSNLGWSEGTKDMEEWIRESNIGDTAPEWWKKIPILLSLTSSLAFQCISVGFLMCIIYLSRNFLLQ